MKKIDLVGLVRSYMTKYGKYVVEDRAIPDFRDGLKPVHRRILWAMYHDVKLSHNSTFAKCAEVVGATIGQYHPHGDQAAYQSLVTLVNCRYNLVEGQGNFGNHANGAAAQRYTECRLSALAMRFFDTIDVIETLPNYNGKRVEPLVLPTRLPFLLMNGGEGIGVGVSTNIPPHNLHELVDALVYLIDNPEASEKAVLNFINGPDYLSGGILISSRDEILKMYKAGQGRLRYRCQYTIEEGKRGLKLLVITGIPPNFNVTSFLEWCKKREDDGTLEYANDESCDEDGLRIVVGWKSSYSLNKIILPKLERSVTYQWNITERQRNDVTFRHSTIFQILKDWLAWRYNIETQYLELKKQRYLDDLERENAKRAAMLNLKKLTNILNTSENLEDDIVKALRVTAQQAKYILDTNLRSLAKLNEATLQKSLDSINNNLAEINGYLANLPLYVRTNLLALAPLFDKRYTEVGNVEEISTQQTGKLWLLASKDGQMERNYDKLTGRWSFDFVTCFDGDKRPALICTKQGLLQPTQAENIRDGRTGLADTVAVFVPNTLVVAIDSNGLAAIFTAPTRRTPLIKNDASLIQCVTFGENDIVWFWNTDNEDVFAFDFIKLKKLSSAQRKFRTICGDYVGGCLVKRPADCVVNLKGELIEKPSALLKAKKWFVVGENNIVVYDKKRELLSKDLTIQAISGGGVVSVLRL